MRFARVFALSPIFLLLLAFCSEPKAHAQQTQVPAYLPPTAPMPNTNTNVGPRLGPFGRQMAERMARERRNELQKQMVTESTQLLVLAQKLNAELATSTRVQLSVSAIKEAQKIEKLAKSIKAKMSYGY